MSDAIRLVKNDTLLRNTSVTFEPFSGLPLVRGDRIQLYQVALNLIMNSLDATAEQPSSDRWVLVRTGESEGGVVQLTVEDSGKGVPETDLTRVFEPFSTKAEGLGMGSPSPAPLSGARRADWAENSVRRGAIFHCVLPWRKQGRRRLGIKPSGNDTTWLMAEWRGCSPQYGNRVRNHGEHVPLA